MKVPPYCNKNNSQNFTSRKLPRYLYHITNTKALEGINSSGGLNAFKNDYHFLQPGIFLFDLDNFLKYWNGTKIGDREVSYTAEIVERAAKSYNLACLRFSCDSLDISSLFVRSIKRLFSTIDTFDDLHHLQKGDTALKRRLYNQRKEPVEYIYTKFLPLNEAQISTGKKVPGFISLPYSEQRKASIEALASVFEDSPEKVAIQKQLDKLV